MPMTRSHSEKLWHKIYDFQVYQENLTIFVICCRAMNMNICNPLPLQWIANNYFNHSKNDMITWMIWLSTNNGLGIFFHKQRIIWLLNSSRNDWLPPTYHFTWKGEWLHEWIWEWSYWNGDPIVSNYQQCLSQFSTILRFYD